MSVEVKGIDESALAEAMQLAPGVESPEPSPLEVRGKIHRLEEEMRKHEQAEIPPVHYFAKGIYAREITIPKGTLLTGKIHRTEHLNIISKGDILVVTEFGRKRIKAPCAFVAQPGTKRVGYALEDTVWTTIHASEERDLEKLEDELIALDYAEFSALPGGGGKPLKAKEE